LLQQPFYFRAFLLCAISSRKFRDSFPDVGGYGGRGPTGDFLDIAIEELQQDFEIVIHVDRLAKRKSGLRRNYS
jgi:hypothetical protein